MRTGYLAARLPDGAVVIRGRVDDELVSDGISVNAFAAEFALASHPGVREAALARGPEGLTAFVVLAPGAPAPSIDELCACAAALPRTHLPRALMLTGALPRDCSGGPDRQALAALAREGIRPAFVAPRDDVERALAAIWAEALGIDRVGIHDDFLDLGGDSIVSIRVAARAARAGLHFTPVDLFKYPTIAALASAVASEVHQPLSRA